MRIFRILFVFMLGTVLTIIPILMLFASDISFEIMSLRLHHRFLLFNREPETPMPILFKKDFQIQPQWDFEEMYKKDPELRQTTCAQSLQHTEDRDFKKSFIPDIKLYMNGEDMNVKEWNRLSHFNNPFGFMEYNYTEMKEALSLIPKPTVPLLVPKPGSNGCIRCAVVATGGILNGSRMGEEIDKHDYVFRMNGAIVKGHEADVGNRTSVYVHSAHSLTTSLIIFHKYGLKQVPNDEGIKYVMIPEGKRDYEWLEGLLKRGRVPIGPYKGYEAWKFYGGQFNETRFYVLNPDFLRYVRNSFLKSWRLGHRSWNIVRPSNGAFTLFLAMHTCDEVHAYGFLTEDHRKYNNYYFEENNTKRTKVIFFQNHDFELEMNTWKKLHQSKIIKLYQREEDNKP